MALPVIHSALECSDFSATVLPYVYQLRALPQIYFESITNPSALRQVYVDTNPLITAFAFSLFLVPIFLLVSEANRNYSQVDRMWSILPTVYNAHYVIYAHLTGMETKRLDTLLTASAIWSIRLTYNYARKGGYNIGSEDYRWEILRTYLNGPQFFLFNVFFISLAQSILLFLVTTPTYVVLLAARISKENPTPTEISEWSMNDLIVSRVMVGLVLVAAVADQQQWNFQNAKATYLKTAKVPANFEREDLDRGFITSKLWAYSRHPNFAAEQTFWVTLYQWSCLVNGVIYNWTAVGAVAYLILFQASTWFTEKVSAKKYEEYKIYQRRVGKFIPKSLNPAEMPKTSAKTQPPAIDGQAKNKSAGEQKRYNLRN